MATPEIKFIAEKALERVNALGLKGKKKRDDAVIDFFCGAATGAQAAGNVELAKHIGMVAYMIVAVRGCRGLVDLLKDKAA
jgi:hypothetical protein